MPELKKELLKEEVDSTVVTNPGSTKMYQDLKRHFLVDWNEKGHSLLCSPMPHLLKSQRRAPEARRILTTSAYPCMEIGANHHGFYHQLPQVNKHL